MIKISNSLKIFWNFNATIVLITLSLVPLLGSSSSKVSAATTLPVYNYTRTFNVSNGSASGDWNTTDKYNNVYVYGTFNGTVIFNPSDLSTSVTTTNTNIFLTKYNSTGTYQWTKTFDTNSTGYSYDSGVKSDSSGNIIIYGSLSGTVSLSGVNGFTKTTQNNNLVIPNTSFINNNLPHEIIPKITSSSNTSFLVKFDTNGNTLWSNIANSDTGYIGTANVTIDKNNNIYGTGQFCGTVNFTNPSNTSNNCTFYVIKYNSGGVFQSIKYSDTNTNINGTYNSWSDGFGLTSDQNGNTYVSGFFLGQVSFNYDGINPGTDTYSNTHNEVEGFITKYNSDGTYAWTKINELQDNQSVDIPTQLAADSYGNVYMIGGYIGIVSFNQTNTQSSLENGIDWSNYLTKYDSNGNYQWTNKTYNQASSSTNNNFSPGGIVIDPYNNVYISGNFAGNIILDGPNGNDQFTSANNGLNNSSYFSKFSSSGSYLYSEVSSYDSSAADASNVSTQPGSLVLDSLGNLYSVGSYSGPVYFNGINNTDENDSGENNGAFLTSWKAFIPPVTSVAVKTPATGFAKGNNTNQIILYSSIFIALSLITGGYIVNKRSKS